MATLNIESTFDQQTLQAIEDLLQANGSGLSQMVNQIVNQIINGEQITIKNYAVVNEELTNKIFDDKYDLDPYGEKATSTQSTIKIILNPQKTHISDDFGIDQLRLINQRSFWNLNRIFDYIIYDLLLSTEDQITIPLSARDRTVFAKVSTDIQMHEMGL